MSIVSKNDPLPSVVKEYLQHLGKQPEKFYTGSVCRLNHDFRNLGLSIRFKANRHCVECSKEDYELNKEEKLKGTRRRYQENKPARKAYNLAYREKHKERLLAKDRKYYQLNKAKRYEYLKQYQKANPHYRLIHSQKRRALETLQAVGKITTKDIKEILKRFHNKCAYCGIRLKKSKHLDHVKPLIKGGLHTKTNLVPACARCNCSKQDSLMTDWYLRQDFYSDLRYRKIQVHTKTLF
jgi:hypothetical protein